MLEPGMNQSLWPVLPPSARARAWYTMPVVRLVATIALVVSNQKNRTDANWMVPGIHA
jgi:hypothetical protein